MFWEYVCTAIEDEADARRGLYLIILLVSIKYGGTGRHSAYFLLHDPRVLVVHLKIRLAEGIFWAASISFPKLAIVTWYLKILRKKWTRRITLLVAITITLNAVSVLLASFLLCRPFAYTWNKAISGGHCGDQMTAYRLVSIPNIVTDVAIMLLPLPTLYKLQISPSKKYGIILTFLIGGW